MLVDGLMHGRGIPLRLRIEPAHLALERRKLPDHVGQEVGLAQRGSLDGLFLDLRGIGSVAEIPDDLLHPLDLVVVGPELFLVNDVLEPGRPFGKRFPDVLFPEESGVLEARLEDALVARADELPGVARDVGDSQKNGKLLPVPDDRKELLALAHRRGQDLDRQLQVALGERALENEREFDVVGQPLQELVVGIYPRPEGGQLLIDLGEDRFLPLFEIDDHQALAHLFPVIGDTRNAEDAGSEDRMADGRIGSRQAFEFDWEGLPVEEGQEALDRPGELEGALPPAHGPAGRTVEAMIPGMSSGEDLRRGLPFPDRSGPEIFARAA